MDALARRASGNAIGPASRHGAAARCQNHRPCPATAQWTPASPSPTSRRPCSSAGASATCSRRSLAQREDAPVWSFYEGPPTANGKPGAHHVLSRVFKDIYPRFRTMRGYRVPRKGGWDCHGLPVELEVERELGLQSKADIEAYGIAEFNARCRDSVFRYVEDWNRLTERIGFWLDLDDAYVTMSNDYIESVWWALRKIWDDGRLYEGHKVVPYCPRCGTALSSHEVAQGYRDVEDPSVYVRLPITAVPPSDERPENALQEGDTLLVWTTTPWTLISNAAVAVGPDIEYVRARPAGLERGLRPRRRARRGGARRERRGPGALSRRVPRRGALRAALHLHRRLRPARPQRRRRRLRHHHRRHGHRPHGDRVRRGRLPPRRAVRDHAPEPGPGRRHLRRPRHATSPGRFVKDADPDIVEALRASGRLLRAEVYEHAYPHCWRCDTPLLYYAKASWYVATTEVRDRMLEENERIDWHPEHIKHGRFGKWLEGNVDWALSRERYWGTPLPVWECGGDDCDERFCAGLDRRPARARHRRGPRRPPPPLHRRGRRCAASRAAARCAACPVVIDAWFDSGSMPFAQFHHPFENERAVRGALPGRVHLRGDRPDARLVLLPARQLGAALRPDELPALRLPRPDPRPRGAEDVEEPRQRRRARRGDLAPRRRRLPLVLPDLAAALGRATASRSTTVGRVGAPVPAHALEHVLVLGPLRERRGRLRPSDVSGDLEAGDDLDRWALSRLQTTTAGRRPTHLDAFDSVRAGQALAAYVDELSNWYVRLSRRRFWDGDRAAFATLRHCLLELTKLLAPFVPFVTDEIYTNLTARHRRRATTRCTCATTPSLDEAPDRPGARARDGGGAADRRARARGARPGARSRSASRWPRP